MFRAAYCLEIGIFDYFNSAHAFFSRWVPKMAYNTCLLLMAIAGSIMYIRELCKEKWMKLFIELCVQERICIRFWAWRQRLYVPITCTSRFWHIDFLKGHDDLIKQYAVVKWCLSDAVMSLQNPTWFDFFGKFISCVTFDGCTLRVFSVELSSDRNAPTILDWINFIYFSCSPLFDCNTAPESGHFWWVVFGSS